MADRDHRQWLEDEEARQKIRKGRQGPAPKLSQRQSPVPDPIKDEDRIAEVERQRLIDWTQDPIA